MDEPIIDAHLPIKPVPKGRPRATYRNGKVQMYTPKDSADFEKDVARLTRYHVTERNENDDLAVNVTFHFPPTPRKAKPDIDNFIKSLFDGCNEVVWHDDRQVTELHAYLDRRATTAGIDFKVTKVRTTED